MRAIRRVLPVETRVAVARLLCHPAIGRVVGRLTRDHVPSRGLRVRTSDPAISPETKASIFWGFYESAEIRLISAHLRRDLDVVELGASLGVTGAHATRRLEAGRRYVAVEANGRLHETLRANIGNGVQLSCLPYAVNAGPDLSPTAFLRLGRTTMSSRLSATGQPAVDTIEVPQRTLSQVLSEAKVGEYQLICDIEGAEAGLFTYDGEAFAQCGLIIAELHRVDAATGIPDLVKMVEALGFDLRAKDGHAYVFARSA